MSTVAERFAEATGKDLVETLKDYKVFEASIKFDKQLGIAAPLPAAEDVHEAFVAQKSKVAEKRRADSFTDEAQAILKDVKAGKVVDIIPKEWLTGGYSDEELLGKIKEAVAGMEEEDKSVRVFGRLPDGNLYFGSYGIKAMIREAFSIDDLFQKRRGLVQVHQHALYAFPELIPFTNGDGGKINEATHFDTVTGCMGFPRRNVVQKFEVVEGAELHFFVILRDVADKTRKLLDDETLERAFRAGEFIGLGASKKRGYGKFSLTKFERIETA